jgi:hypothetical protein
VARQSSAKASTAVRIRSGPLFYINPSHRGRFFCNMDFPKILYWLGRICCVLLIIACFMPWAYYSDSSIANETQRTFTGFYSYQNYYGKPGKFLTFFAACSLLLKILPRVWAKRVDLFLCAIAMAYGLKSFFEYKGVYGSVVPQLHAGLFLMLGSLLVMMAAAIFPDLKIVQAKK